jgi:hypothetical protein
MANEYYIKYERYRAAASRDRCLSSCLQHAGTAFSQRLLD